MATISRQAVFTGFALVYMAGSTFAAVRFYDMYKYYEARVPKTDKEVEKELATLLPQVKKIMQVPDETPVIATVKDATSLKAQQTFFVSAENGDKLLVFQVAKKAVLFRPSTNKIIESGPLLVTPNDQQQSSQQVQSVKMAIYNGTKDKTLTATVDEKLKTAAGPLLQTVTDVAKSTDYKSTIVVDVTGKNKQSVDEVAKFLGGTVSTTIPAGEVKPDADILVIIGATQ